METHSCISIIPGRERPEKADSSSFAPGEARVSPASRSVIIHDFAIKSPFFMSLGACRLKRSSPGFPGRIVRQPEFYLLGGGGAKKNPPSGLTASCSGFAGGHLDFQLSAAWYLSMAITTLLPRISPLGAGSPRV